MIVFIHMSWLVIIVPHQDWACHLLHIVCHCDRKAWALKLKMARWPFLQTLIAWLRGIWAAALGVFLRLSPLTDTFTSHPFIYCRTSSGSSIIQFLKMTVFKASFENLFFLSWNPLGQCICWHGVRRCLLWCDATFYNVSCISIPPPIFFHIVWNWNGLMCQESTQHTVLV